jgi:ureidoglycolate hydrolase
MNVPVVEARKTDISEYGIVVYTEGKLPDAETEDFSFWDGLGELEFSSGSVGLVRSYPHSSHTCPSLERHGKSPEALIPVNGDIVVVCALSKMEEPREVNQNTLKALMVQKGEALILHPGVWHYAPMVRDTVVDTFVIFRKDTLLNDLVKEVYGDPSDLEVRF